MSAEYIDFEHTTSIMSISLVAIATFNIASQTGIKRSKHLFIAEKVCVNKRYLLIDKTAKRQQPN